MRKAALLFVLAAVLALATAQAYAASLSSSVSLYLEYDQEEFELIASRTVNWEVKESWHLTVSTDLIYRYESLFDLKKVATALDVAGTRTFGNISLTLGNRIRTDQMPRWYLLATLQH